MADGSYEVENYFYLDEDWYEYDFERMVYDIDGAMTEYTYTDSWGNSNT
jgi:hypothetical protein